MPVALAVDIGGTKLAAGLVDESGQLRVPRSVPTAGSNAEDLFARLVALVDGVLAAGADAGAGAGGGAGGPPIVCGVGCGGPMAPAGQTVSPLNIPAWREFPLRRRLAAHVGLPTFVDNDAKALALGEGWIGAAAGEANFIAMVVSTGIGGGVVLDGRLLDGAAGNAGHIGHVIVEPGGRSCGCGASGCLEAEASGLAIAAITGRPAHEAPPAIVERTGRLVGRAVASVASLLDLQLAVVAGSVALGFGAPFFAAANDQLRADAQIEYSRGAVIRPAGLGAAGPLIGAAAVAWRAAGVDIGIAPPAATATAPEDSL